MMFAVRLKNKEYIGNIRLNDIDYQIEVVLMEDYLENKVQRKGIWNLFLYKICQVAFEKLKLNKIFTPVYQIIINL